MKAKIIVKIVLICIFGTIMGLFTQHTHEKWHRLGRTAYLTSQSEWFDKKMATSTTVIGQIAEWAAIACVIGSVYECAAYVGTALLTRKQPSQNS